MQKNRNMTSKYERLRGLIVFFVVYMAGFSYIENRNVSPHIIYTSLDGKIPFCQYFVIPYLLWFLFVAFTLIYFLFYKEDNGEYDQLAKTICAGSVVFLMVSFFYPNGQELRPDFTGNGICGALVRLIYKMDTPTNILPSLHVFHSVACCIAILKTEVKKYGNEIKAGTIILTILIILSTMFLKQHSVVDVVTAVFFNLVFYLSFYKKAVWDRDTSPYPTRKTI